MILSNEPLRAPYITAFGLVLAVLSDSTAAAQSAPGGYTPIVATQITDNPDDPENQLAWIESRRRDRAGVFEIEPLGGLRRGFTGLSDTIYDKTGLRLGLAFHHVFQWADPVNSGTDNYATTTDFDVNGKWEIFNRDQPNQGNLVFNIEGRWDYGTIGPQNLGFASLGTSGGTANSFSAYDPTFLMRQFYFTQGSKEAGWSYRVGKVTVDGVLTSSRHINPNQTFLPNAGTGMFTNSPADSGLGAIGSYSFDESWSVLGLISDANANRSDLGDIGAGDFYKAVELQWKTSASVERAAGAKFTTWQTDGTKDGTPINGNTGKSGYGFGALYEMDLTPDGRSVIVARYGQSFDGAAIYDAQAGLHFLLYQPAGALRFDDDVFGVAINWVDTATPGGREEVNIETFYRFPLFPKVDMTVSYQYINNPANTREFDNASAFSMRLTSTF
jgi:porin